MFDEALYLKIGAVFEIMSAAVLGAGFPFLYIHMNQKLDDDVDFDSKPIFFILKSISCGVIIGVALLHLLPDAEETLSDEYAYPVSFALIAVGIILCLSSEQFAMWIVSTTPAAVTHDLDEDELTKELLQAVVNTGNTAIASGDGEEESPFDHNIEADVPAIRAVSPLSNAHHNRTLSRGHKAHNKRQNSNVSVNNRSLSAAFDGRRKSRVESSCEMGMVVQLFANSNDTKTLLKAYVLEGAIAVHSIIMGLSLGAMQNSDLTSIKVLMVAYGIHQLLEGISLGCAISSAKLSSGKIFGLICFFACTLPSGIILGILITNSEDDYTSMMVEAYANGVAGGILIYVSMVEMMADEFSNDLVRNDYYLKFKMIFAITLGITVMGILAIWA